MLAAPPQSDMGSEEGRRRMGVPYDQVWVVVMYESSMTYSRMHGVYNYTMTFRRDSDVYSPYCGRFELANKGRTIADIEPKLEAFRTSGKRNKQVAWMVSNCGAPNFRLEYAKELAKYIQVDIYGRCSPNGLECRRRGSTDRSCWEMIAEDYKFYLSFESSHCKDYITEKFYMPMYFGILPVVYGAASTEDYAAIAPKHSYIDTRNFKSPKELADYLTMLDKSPDEYNAYFAWRKRYMVHNNRTFLGQDILCAKLWNLETNRHGYSKEELNTWWNKGENCVEPPYKPEEEDYSQPDASSIRRKHGRPGRSSKHRYSRSRKNRSNWPVSARR